MVRRLMSNLNRCVEGVGHAVNDELRLNVSRAFLEEHLPAVLGVTEEESEAVSCPTCTAQRGQACSRPFTPHSEGAHWARKMKALFRDGFQGAVEWFWAKGIDLAKRREA
jgi:hypothetical protein